MGANNASRKTNRHKGGGMHEPSKADFREETKGAVRKTGKYILVAIGVLAMVLSVSTMACVGIFGQSQSDTGYELTGGVAATVNGVNITEDTVTKQIMSTRESLGYSDDADWASYLAQSGLTPESYREQVIDSYARQYLVSKAIDEYDAQATDEQIEDRWQEAVSNYDSEDAFIEQITSYGYDEDSYKEMLASSIAQENLTEAVAPLKDPTDDEIIDYVNENLDTYNGARRSSNILIKVAEDADDATRKEAKAKAQDILDQIRAGDITFEDAAKKYSEDTSADDGGDVGWDKLTTFVTEYQDALSKLDKGEVSGVVESTYGYHIIMCTDYFHVDDKVTKVDQIPEDLRSQISDTIASSNQQTAYNEWLDSYIDDADIEINPMPENVPYNVDMDLANSSDDSSDATADEASADSADADASGDTSTGGAAASE